MVAKVTMSFVIEDDWFDNLKELKNALHDMIEESFIYIRDVEILVEEE